MADATVLKTVEGNLVRVRLPSSAPTTPQINLWGVLFCDLQAKLAQIIAANGDALERRGLLGDISLGNQPAAKVGCP